MPSSLASSGIGMRARSSGVTRRSTSIFAALRRASRKALLARLHGVGARHVDIDVGHRVGAAAALRMRAAAGGKSHQKSDDDRGKPAGENQRMGGIAGVRFLAMFAPPI